MPSGDAQWAIAFTGKILAFFLILNAAALPILRIVQVDLKVYSLIIGYEGTSLVILGGFLLFMSAVPTIERDTYQYTENGFFRRDTIVRKVRGGDRRLKAFRGLILTMLGLLFWLASLSAIWLIIHI
ncbi:MAG: hypothetical protein JSV58_00490 [Candidatus Bathyarchaeota archaeon]|nr:MAG: hypothetical protein JSV58_00490 [Candidatus Bathyarchaeota archaeon]